MDCDHRARLLAAETGQLAGLLREFRQRALLTQEELAERAQVSVGTIRGVEAGRIRRPRSGSSTIRSRAP